ncbi:MAG: trypsin-like peptidase domain-containing protein [Vicinamibacterales bacterium]|nr:trypsin-like peptidase domain-containing protein [Vicinamibacterales bacterium]
MKRLIFAALSISVGFLAGLVLTGRLPGALVSTAAPQSAPAAGAEPAAMPAGPATEQAVLARPAGLPDFTLVAEDAIRAVTNIASMQVVRQRNTPFGDDPFFNYFFGDQSDMFGWRDRQSESLGSGVIVSSDGYVLTNNHVVGENAADITVSFADKRDLQATVVGVDPATDIALLKVKATGLPAIPWGDSSQLKVAEWVLAIGNPFQLNSTVTLGIVSAKGRANVGVAAYEDFIQTDAAINPGNSGGALVNARGQLVGINTAIYSRSGGYQGVGFAVPSNLARRVMNDLIKYGEVRRGSIGYIEVRPLTASIAEQMGTPSHKGVWIYRMRKNSTAYEAGMRPGDAIVSLSGKPVEDVGQLARGIADAPAGGTVSIGAYREGRKIEFRVRVESGATRQ